MSSTKYHINNDGDVRVCHARKKPCPFGGKENHFKTRAIAEKVAQERLEQEYGVDYENTVNERIHSHMKKYNFVTVSFDNIPEPPKTTKHYEKERRTRRQRMKRLIGENGNRVLALTVDQKGKRGKYIYEYFENGVVKIRSNQGPEYIVVTAHTSNPIQYQALCKKAGIPVDKAYLAVMDKNYTLYEKYCKKNNFHP